ncbi:MAG: flagellar basal body P-ring protein FlgI [Gammaproteobacteria bacterium]|jgi:flagellar P-ring protein precursor FlgI
MTKSLFCFTSLLESRHGRCRFLAVLLLTALPLASLHAERVKDLTTVAGVRGNQLVGYGIVVGLDGTGDRTTQAPFTSQSMINMLQRFGVTLPPDTNLQINNVATVIVQAELPPFATPGQTIDVTVSSLANAESLRGGTLFATPLTGLDDKIYAIAQGNVLVGGLGVSGNDGSRVSINVPTVGRIPNGATVEVAAPSAFAAADFLELNLHRPDFTTATRLASTINETFGPRTALASDATKIRVQAPLDPDARVAFLSMIENLEFDPGEAPARVIVNSRSGTVVISQHVRVMPAAVSHGSLVVTITESFDVSQPVAPFSDAGQTVVTADTGIDVAQDDSRMFLFEPGVDLNEIVRAVNEVGAAPGDLVVILEALREAGALRAELIVI